MPAGLPAAISHTGAQQKRKKSTKVKRGKLSTQNVRHCSGSPGCLRVPHRRHPPRLLRSARPRRPGLHGESGGPSQAAKHRPASVVKCLAPPERGRGPPGPATEPRSAGAQHSALRRISWRRQAPARRTLASPCLASPARCGAARLHLPASPPSVPPSVPPSLTFC